MKVYVITAGEYSCYHIVGVTLEKETAEQFVKNRKHKYDEFEIEEYDSDFIKEVTGKQVFFVRYNVESKRYLVYDESTTYFVERSEKVVHNQYVYWTYVFAENEQDALKIGKDRIIPALVRDGILEG